MKDYQDLLTWLDEQLPVVGAPESRGRLADISLALLEEIAQDLSVEQREELAVAMASRGGTGSDSERIAAIRSVGNRLDRARSENRESERPACIDGLLFSALQRTSLLDITSAEYLAEDAERLGIAPDRFRAVVEAQLSKEGD